MNFEQLKKRVERSEQVVDGRMLQTRLSWSGLQTNWKEGWTPPRILIVGALLGFISGKAQPARTLRHVGQYANPKMMQLVTSVAGLVASVQSTFAASKAKTAADTADEAATTADVAATTADVAVGTATGAAVGGTGATPAARAAAARAAAEAAALEAGRPRSDRSRPDPQWDRQPSPAEAATDLSER
ncbi:protein sip-5 [Luteimonas yindakuii]|uniref:Protein sip-5 n=1 Tax=Luteimonas yindakuii TaxID=2565782 RepID=A0A4Z1R8G0_9GAMM|nr:protein sip-5 [Luteimonas yindakuii]QCO68459.1 protein sip-5 [Luteimonas yindakuii]TKS54885.1 protein sip-5 [Luteimonas yindakuii]